MLKKYKREDVYIYLLLFIAVLMRFIPISHKPIHFDESINGWFVQEMWKNGFFQYDPNNYHGPLYFYFLQWSELIFGKSIESYRVVTALFSVMTIYVLVDYQKTLFNKVLVGTLSILSPAMAFYGLSAIHEPVFVFFLVVSFVNLLKYRDFSESKFLGRAVFYSFVAFCLKETVSIYILALLISYGLIYYNQMGVFYRDLVKVKMHFLFGLVFCLIFFSGFGLNWRGVVDMFVAYLPWFKTGIEGAGHQKSFWYWIQLILKYEWSVILSFILGLFICFKSLILSQTKTKVISVDRKTIFIFVFSLLQLLIYSYIPYKTPWCILSIVWPFFILLGDVYKYINHQILKIILAAIAGFASFYIQSQIVLQQNIQLDHPYIYVQSTYQVKSFIETVNRFEKNNPQFKNSHIYIAASESYPYAWLFYDYQNVHYGTLDSYFTDASQNFEKETSVILIEQEDVERLELKIDLSQYYKSRYQMRTSKPTSWIYLSKKYFSEQDQLPITRFVEGGN